MRGRRRFDMVNNKVVAVDSNIAAVVAAADKDMQVALVVDSLAVGKAVAADIVVVDIAVVEDLPLEHSVLFENLVGWRRKDSRRNYKTTPCTLDTKR